MMNSSIRTPSVHFIAHYIVRIILLLAHFDPCSAFIAISERLKNLSTTSFCARRGLVLALPKFDVFVVVMKISPNLLYPPIKAVVDILYPN